MAPTKVYVTLVLGLALQLIHVHGAPPLLSNEDVCTTPQCVLTAAAILRDMNPHADPCEDFNAYTCGGFLEREEIPQDQESTGYFHVLHDQNNRIIKSIVDVSSVKTPKGPVGSGDADNDSDSGSEGDSSESSEAAQRNLQKLRDLYSSCMDEVQITKVGRQPVVDEIKKLLNEFPVAGSTLIESVVVSEPSMDEQTQLDRNVLSMTLAYMGRLGLDTINSFDVSTDLKDSKRHVLELSEGGLGLPSKEYYLDDRTMEIYETTIGKMFNLILGEDAHDVDGNSTALSSSFQKEYATEVPAKWAAIAKDVVAFEKQLAAASTNINDLRDSYKTYNPRTLVDISIMTPSIDWSMFLTNVLPAGTDIPQPIIVTSPAFQQRLEELLQRTTPQSFQQFLVWTMIRQLSGNLAQRYRQPLRELNSVLSGVSANVTPDRSKHCVSVVNGQLGDMAGQYFVEESFKGNSRKQVNEMIETLRAAYIHAFPELDWLDATTTAGAIKKMKAIVQLIGFSTDSPNVGSSLSLELYYSGYKVDAKDYFANQMRVGLWSVEKAFRELNRPVNMLKMHMVPQTVNAYYSPTQNQIVFPAGILQPPFFHTDNPEYVNYGGVVAGHEITHGFDNEGHLFDSDGRLTNWWSNATSEAFYKKARCFVDQYSNFTVKGADGKDYHVNGELTLGENIADNGGLKQSFAAWQARYKSDTSGRKYKNSRLPGLDGMTTEQLFFISYARPWCSKQRAESAIRQMRTDPHSPARWRINGAVQNSEAFALAFGCSKGAAMNPEKKCDLW
ncbi:hypothetical protein BGZ99_010013 [Dissophora globulifera]|uniref:Uncharacterized protein n=1 Tax=Dissophora globulifera TaxID=979702 RepID=A0A9P6V0I4_9FUNG|nr:hypothetical protein BGZ99_010013 [Dissophora globulifera]